MRTRQRWDLEGQESRTRKTKTDTQELLNDKSKTKQSKGKERKGKTVICLHNDIGLQVGSNIVSVPGHFRLSTWGVLFAFKCFVFKYRDIYIRICVYIFSLMP